LDAQNNKNNNNMTNKNVLLIVALLLLAAVTVHGSEKHGRLRRNDKMRRPRRVLANMKKKRTPDVVPVVAVPELGSLRRLTSDGNDCRRILDSLKLGSLRHLCSSSEEEARDDR
jgi:hypothetical protein